MKKLIFSLVTVITAVALLFGIGCDNDTHTWSDKWSGNDSNHWHDCTDSGCKQRSDITPHTWFLTSTLEKSTCTEEGSGTYTCFVCGRTKTDKIEKSGHNWKLIYTEFAANCITEGRGSFRCSDCAIVQDKMIIPPTGVHDFDTAWSCDKAGHYHVCKVDGCGATTDSINHVETGPITIEAEDYKDGADEMRCADCGYVISSVRRPAKSVPVTFEVQFGSILATDGSVVLRSGSTYKMSYPNAVNEEGESITLPYYSGGVGVSIYLVTNADEQTQEQITYASESLGFTTFQGNLYPKQAGIFTLIFSFRVNGKIKHEVPINVLVS